MKTVIAYYIAFLSLFVIAPLTFMTFDTLPPYEFDLAGSYIVPAQTKAGHQVTVHWKLLRMNRSCPGTVTRSIIDVSTGVKIMYDPVLAAQGVQMGDGEFDRTFRLPQAIPTGKKIYYSEGAYGCNLLQQYWKPLLVRTPSLEFEVLP